MHKPFREYCRTFVRICGRNFATQGQQKALKRKTAGSCNYLLAKCKREKGGRKSVRFCSPVCACLRFCAVTIRSANLKRSDNPKRTQTKKKSWIERLREETEDEQSTWQ